VAACNQRRVVNKSVKGIRFPLALQTNPLRDVVALHFEQQARSLEHEEGLGALRGCPRRGSDAFTKKVWRARFDTSASQTAVDRALALVKNVRRIGCLR
jgi:hypothetical protein